MFSTVIPMTCKDTHWVVSLRRYLFIDLFTLATLFAENANNIFVYTHAFLTVLTSLFGLFFLTNHVTPSDNDL